jgi:hypothetical protein
VTNGFRSDWAAKVYADLCSIVSTGRLNGKSPLPPSAPLSDDPLRAHYLLIIGLEKG